MNWRSNLVLGLLMAIMGTSTVMAQHDETRSATGLPMKTGENTAPGSRMNVSGRIKLEGGEG